MKDFLARRYDAANKLLNLSNIVDDQEILKSGMFATEATQKKFFPALMIVCDDMLETQEAKEAAIQSVTLSGNGLSNLNSVYKLCWQLNHIKNLDLSNNAFSTLESLKPWKQRFKNLEHIIVDPFPIPAWEEELTSWFPRLKIINDIQVRGNNNNNTNNTLSTAPANNSSVPTPISTPTPNITANPEQQRKEEMILYVQQQTNLKREYALQCLEAAQWNIEQAGVLFTQSQPTLPPEAYN